MDIHENNVPFMYTSEFFIERFVDMKNEASNCVIVHMPFFFWQAKFKQNYER